MNNPMVRNNICLNVDPEGCAAMTRHEIDRVRAAFKASSGAAGAPRRVLVVGCSTGYGLASRITAAFGYGAATVGVSFEREPGEKKTGSPGWYDNRAFDQAAAEAGIPSVTIEGDAFSKDVKARVVEAMKGLGGEFDLVVYSIASPVRIDPETGVMYRSVIKPVGRTYTGTTVDLMTGELKEAVISPATPEEVAATVKVMGGEDWKLWIEALLGAKVLASGARTVAYSYIGPSLSHAIYREGTIGRAKEDLERTAKELDGMLATSGGHAWVSINKCVATRASAVIPGIGLYVAVLFKVMKELGIHEDCTDQMVRLFRERLFSGGPVPVDAGGLIRLDDREMRDEVQRETAARMKKLTRENLAELADVDGVRTDFLQAHGFAVPV